LITLGKRRGITITSAVRGAARLLPITANLLTLAVGVGEGGTFWLAPIDGVEDAWPGCRCGDYASQHPAVLGANYT